MRFFINKFIKMRNLFKNFLNKIIVSRKKLEIIIKFLLFIIKIMIFKKTFLKRFFNVISKLIIIIQIIIIIKKDFL